MFQEAFMRGICSFFAFTGFCGIGLLVWIGACIITWIVKNLTELATKDKNKGDHE